MKNKRTKPLSVFFFLWCKKSLWESLNFFLLEIFFEVIFGWSICSNHMSKIFPYIILFSKNLRFENISKQTIWAIYDDLEASDLYHFFLWNFPIIGVLFSKWRILMRPRGRKLPLFGENLFSQPWKNFERIERNSFFLISLWRE